MKPVDSYIPILACVVGVACSGADRGAGAGDDSGPPTDGDGTDEESVVEIDHGSFPKVDDIEVQLTGIVKDLVDGTSGELTEAGVPVFAASIFDVPTRLAFVDDSGGEGCWAGSFEYEDFTDKWGDTIPLDVGDTTIAMEQWSEGLYVAITEGETAAAASVPGLPLSIGGAHPDLGIPLQFHLENPIEAFEGAQVTGTLDLEWTQPAEGYEGFIQVVARDVDNNSNIACALKDDGHATIALGTPSIDLHLLVARAQTAVFESEFGLIAGTLMQAESIAQRE